MSRDDFYASPFGAIYSTYMERPRLSRRVSRAVFGGDTKPYYDSMQAVAQVPEGSTIVDCPCGAGPALRALDPALSVRYVAADLSPSMIRRARRRARARGLEGVEFVEADATALPLRSESADLFLSLWGLHCFDDPEAALTEAARILRPEGRLVGACFLRGRDSLRQRLLIRSNRGDFGKVASEPEILGWLDGAGFEVSGTGRSGPMLFFDARRRPGGS
jgi:SAM-dependent methyltransferase